MRRVLYIAAVAFVLVFGGGVGFIYSGFYNVSAMEEHWPVTRWAMETARIRSIKAHAAGIAAPPTFDDPGNLLIGTEHFAAHCAVCHGAPGVPRGDIARGLYPEPPELTNAAKLYTPGELFWILKNGIKMTGMPAWSDHGDDELWATVAFLKKLPNMSQQDYAKLVMQTMKEDEHHHHQGESGASGSGRPDGTGIRSSLDQLKEIPCMSSTRVQFPPTRNSTDPECATLLSRPKFRKTLRLPLFAALLLLCSPESKANEGRRIQKGVCQGRLARVDVRIRAEPVTVLSDFGLQQIRTLAGQAGQPLRHPPYGLYISRLRYAFQIHEIAPSADQCAPTFRITGDLALTDRQIEIASDLTRDSCLFPLALEHYKLHAEADEQAFHEFTSTMPAKVDTALKQVANNDATLRKIEGVVGKLLADLDRSRAAARAQVDTQADVDKLSHPECPTGV